VELYSPSLKVEEEAEEAEGELGKLELLGAV
jgi:hypothetical protein